MYFDFNHKLLIDRHFVRVLVFYSMFKHLRRVLLSRLVYKKFLPTTKIIIFIINFLFVLEGEGRSMCLPISLKPVHKKASQLIPKEEHRICLSFVTIIFLSLRINYIFNVKSMFNKSRC